MTTQFYREMFAKSWRERELARPMIGVGGLPDFDTAKSGLPQFDRAPKSPDPVMRRIPEEMLDTMWGMIRSLTEQRNEAVLKLGEANTMLAHLTALLAARDAQKTESVPAPDGALAPIQRNTSLGGMLAALRSANPST